ncbi:MAG: hypothetical protein JETCAE03_35420 [Ignavibacteriaceae bacterium]|nr:MAG: hypothetical protein JETCAE03_35420 [Ignavibacteriaceae bacterium]
MEIKISKHGFKYIVIQEMDEPDRTLFNEWLVGQTRPIVEEEGRNSMRCAYLDDYDRWKDKLPIID